MKKRVGFYILLLSCCLAGVAGCKERRQPGKVADTRMEVVQKFRDFGEVQEGEEVCHTYRIKNTGEHNLLIKKVETDCGCTVATYDKKPIAPGGEGKIEITFNSAGRYGKQYKEIRIFANIPEKQATLVFSADVK